MQHLIDLLHQNNPQQVGEADPGMVIQEQPPEEGPADVLPHAGDNEEEFGGNHMYVSSDEGSAAN